MKTVHTIASVSIAFWQGLWSWHWKLISESQ